MPNPKPVPCCRWQLGTFPDNLAGKGIPDYPEEVAVGQIIRLLQEILSTCSDVACVLFHGRWNSGVKAMADDSAFLAGDQAVLFGRPLKNLPKSCEWDDLAFGFSEIYEWQ